MQGTISKGEETFAVSQGISAREIRGLIVFGVLFAAAVYLSIQFIGAILGIIVLFSLVALIVLVLTPGVGWLERHKIPRPVSAGMMAFLVLGAVGLIGWLAVPPAARQMKELVLLFPSYILQAHKWLAARGGIVGSGAGLVDPNRAAEMVVAKAGPILSRIGTYTVSAVTLVVSGFVVFISVVYTLASPRPIVEGALRLFNADQGQRFADVMQKIALQMRHWGMAMAAGMAAIFTLTWILLGLILHVPFAFLFSVIAGLLEIVPTVGPILSSIPPILVTLANDPAKAIWVALGFIVIQQIEGHLIIPLILGGGLKLHPVGVIFAVMVMGGLFGVLGIFLAVPTLAVIKTLVEEFYPLPKEAGKEQDVSEKVERIVSGQSEEGTSQMESHGG
jgi:predicted PurR-regulated permease PerM